MSKIEQALREWAEWYWREALPYGGPLNELAERVRQAGTKEGPLCPKFPSQTTVCPPWDCTCDDPEPAPWTFGDLEVGDWFEDPTDGTVWQKVDGLYAAPGGFEATDQMFGLETIVHPFEWEWAE